MTTQDHTSATNNTHPEWAYLKETILMINLAIARIEHGMCDGNESVTALTDSFTALADSVTAIDKASAQLPDSEATNVIRDNCSASTEKVQAAIIAFQFYDKLTQRLTHVSRSLEAVAGLIGDESHRYREAAWQELQTKIKSKYTLDSDQKMLAAIMQGKSVDEVLQEHVQQPAADDVELF